MNNIRYARSIMDIESCHDVVLALRPHVQKENFVQRVQEMMKESYQLIYVCEGEKPVACAGFRNMYMLYGGKIIYIDDLSTLPDHRGKGYAGQLLDFIHHLAKETGKDAVHLDSGYQRNDAHRLYLNKGYKMIAHHFTKEMNG